MDGIKLYVFLPNGSNAKYNQCHHISENSIDKFKFLHNFKLLHANMGYLDIKQVCYIGSEPLLFARKQFYFDVVNILGFKQTVLTNGIQFLNNIKELNKKIQQIDICRINLDDNDNKVSFMSVKTPKIFQLEKMFEYFKSQNQKGRLIVPITKRFNEDTDKFISLAKYLGVDIIFRQLIFQQKIDINPLQKHYNKCSKIYEQSNQNYRLNMKQIKDVNVGFEYIIKTPKKNNENFLVYHPNGELTNSFSK